MDISGSHRIPAPRNAVWDGLNNPDILRSCIPGCERLEQVSDHSFRGVAGAKVGPVRAVLAGEASLTGGPDAFTLAVRAADDKAGGGEGSADVTLAEEAGETILSYAGRFEASGKVSQLGARLLTGVVRTNIETFLARFSDVVIEARPAGPAGRPPSADAPPLAPEETSETATVADRAPGELQPTLAELAFAPGAIAPTAVPDVPDAAQIAAIEATEPAAEGGGAVTRVMLVAAIVVVVAVGIYFLMLQPPG